MSSSPALFRRSAAKRADKKKADVLLTAAVVLVALGLGNMLFGHVKLLEYEHILSEANAELTSPEKKRRLPVFAPTVNIDKHTQYIEKLESRICFYRFVVVGGAFFAALGLVLLLIFVVSYRKSVPAPPDHPASG